MTLGPPAGLVEQDFRRGHSRWEAGVPGPVWLWGHVPLYGARLFLRVLPRDKDLGEAANILGTRSRALGGRRAPVLWGPEAVRAACAVGPWCALSPCAPRGSPQPHCTVFVPFPGYGRLHGETGV